MGASAAPLAKIRASGGEQTPLFALNTQAGERGQRVPAVLSDGEHLLYYSVRGDPARNENGIYLARLDGKGEAKRIYAGVPFQYLAPDALLVYENGNLAMVRFNPETGETGEPEPLSGDYAGLREFSVSADGRNLAFVRGSGGAEQITLYDRGGRKVETIAEARPNQAAHLEMSPDGKRFAFERTTGSSSDVWTVELDRNVVSRLTFHASNETPGSWSADGRKVYFLSNREGGTGIYEIPAGGAGTEKLIHKVRTHHLHASPDGKYILFERGAASTALDLLELAGGKVSEYLPKPAFHPQFSQDSRYVAYEADETGRREVYVQTFPPGKGRWMISQNGGMQTRWRGDGKELFYINEGKVMAAAIEIKDGSLEVTSTKELFSFRHTGTAGTAMTVTPDGKMFGIREGGEGGSSPILLRMNVKLPGR